MQVARSPAGRISCSEHVSDPAALPEVGRTNSFDNVESMCADLTSGPFNIISMTFIKGSDDITASLGDAATHVYDNNSDGFGDTGAEIRTVRPSAPVAITAELADTTTQLRTIINEMRRLHPTTCHSSAKLSVPEHPTTVHAPPKMEYMGLDARLCEIRLGHAGAAAIRTQRQVAKPQSDF